MLGGTELFLVIGALVVLFGADRVSDIAQSTGKTVGTVKQQKAEIDREIQAVEQDIEEATTLDGDQVQEPGATPQDNPATPGDDFTAPVSFDGGADVSIDSDDDAETEQ